MLVVQRCAELVSHGTSIGRRPRTLTPRAALMEACVLAGAYFRADGITNAAASPENAGHGVKMLPDVAAEAAHVLAGDPVLKSTGSSLPEHVLPHLRQWASEQPQVDPSAISRLEAFAASLERTYLSDVFTTLDRFVTKEPEHLFALEAVCGCLVSELRHRGWADKTLSSIFSALNAEAPADLTGKLRQGFPAKPSRFRCYVPVSLGGLRLEQSFREHTGLPVLPKLPVSATDRSLPQRGPFVEIEVEEHDAQTAAEQAYSQVSATIGALAIFKPENVEMRSRVVGVSVTGSINGHDISAPEPIERRETTQDEVNRILAGTRPGKLDRDAVFDAIRHRTRAHESQDPESRFILLWFALERLVLGAPGQGKTLSAARALIPKAIAIGKVRSEILGLGAAILQLGLTDEEWSGLFGLVGWKRESRRIDHAKLLAMLQSPKKESEKLTAFFYERDVRLVQWYERLRKALYGSKPAKIVPLFEESRRRIDWQVMRLYRARNSVAHAGQGPSWLRDLTFHANHYLTQLIAIVVHHRQRTPGASSAEILSSRAGQYDAFLALLKSGDPRALEPKHLLKPTLLVGT